jgi:restriction system protein
MFITTSDFTVGAREVAAEDRDKEVQLVKGEELVQVMLEHGLGVRAEPQVTYGVDEDFFTG